MKLLSTLFKLGLLFILLALLFSFWHVPLLILPLIVVTIAICSIVIVVWFVKKLWHWDVR